MANDTTRNRQDNPAEDPLAELARLMGQEDEFADLMRKAQPAPRPVAPRPAAPPPGGVSAGAPRAPLPPRPVSTRPAAPPARPAAPASSHSSFAALAADVYSDAPRRPGAASQPRAESHSLEDAARNLNRNLVRPDRPAPEPRAVAPRPEARTPEPRVEPRVTSPRPSAPAARSGLADTGVDAVARALSQPLDLGDEPSRAEGAPPAWMSRSAASARAEAEAPAARDFSAADDAYDYGRSAEADEGYDDDVHADSGFEVEDVEDAPRRGRRRLLVVGGLVAVVAVAVVGGYVLLSRPGGIASSSGGEPPVIRADQGPNKVVPTQPAQPEQASDGQKLIYDRVGGNAPTGNEKVVSSEEQPVDVSQAAQPQQPRVISTTPAPSGASATPASSSATEPKRVRTLTVRADGTIVEDTSPTPVPGDGQPTNTASAQPTASASIPLSSGSGAPVSTNPTPLASTPSIVPNVSAAAPAAAPEEPAPAPAPRVAAAPAPAPAASSAAPAGAYVVQIASVRTEAEAQATIRSMQAKYAGVLGGQPSSVRRADLGDRGIYYRAQVGSFGSRDEAVKLCEALRAQGGDCMVQRN